MPGRSGRKLTPEDPEYRPPSGIPANGTRPPFEPGNEAAVTHGAYSDKRVAPLATLARAEIVEAAPWLEAEAFGPALDAWSRAEARVALVDSWLQEHGLLDPEGKPRPAAEFVVKLERAAADLRARIGLDPASCVKIRAQLASATSADALESLRAEGRKILEAREAELEAGDSS